MAEASSKLGNYRFLVYPVNVPFYSRQFRAPEQLRTSAGKRVIMFALNIEWALKIFQRGFKMKHTRLLMTGLLIVVMILALAAFSPGKQSASTLAVVERAETDVVTDTGEKDDSVGDILTFANKVYDEKNEKEIGSDNGYCLRTAVGSAWECNWTLTLADGSIVIEGPFYDTKDSVVAITGGTGKYADARGSMKLHARNDKGTEYDFVYEFVQ
jgi:allene oxide cyclase